MKIVHDNILNFKGNYIAHQCNTTSTNVKGLAKTLFDAYPRAHHRSKSRKVGSISVSEHVINMYAQINPGVVSFPGLDSKERRLKYFKMCLNKIRLYDMKSRHGSTLGIVSLAFPYRIGCGLAGGDWGKYMDLLSRFDYAMKFPIYLYKYDI